jgi:hypothetical protein
MNFREWQERREGGEHKRHCQWDPALKYRVAIRKTAQVMLRPSAALSPSKGLRMTLRHGL